ncbi:radical SAM protein [Flindersiella endophytica]
MVNSTVLLDLLERVNSVSAGSQVEVPITPGDADLVARWCTRMGHQLVGVDDGIATLRRGPVLDDEAVLALLPPSQRPGHRLWIYTNFDCNLACDYCCARSSPQAERRALGVDQITRLAEQAAEAGVGEIFLTGGEPFMLPDLDQIVAACVTRLPTTLLTNGMLFRGSRLAMLRRMPRDEFTLQISLDSATPDTHNRHRGTGSWQRALDGVETARTEGFRVRVAATVDAGTPPADLAVFHDLLDTLGVGREDQIVRPVAKRGFAETGITLTRETLIPEITVTANGVYWHPVGADHADQLLTHQPFPLANAIDKARRLYVEYRRTTHTVAQRFPCA